VGIPKGKRSPERHRRGWEDNIKINFRGIGYCGMDWIDPAKDRDQW
jgi:hypothetical protein